MTTADLIAISPLLAVAGASVLVLLIVAFGRHHGLTAVVTLIGIAAAAGLIPSAAPLSPRQVTPLLRIDAYAILYMGLVFAASFAVAVFSYGYLSRRPEGHREEFYVVLLLAVLGSAVMVASDHFASFFLGLETLTVSLYVLIAYLRAGPRGLEAGLKYLVLAGASSAFLLFGMALIYGELGTLEFSAMSTRVAGSAANMMMLTGTALMITGIGFKLALVPFHMWTPDVYEGAPAPVTAFLATVSKGAMFALILRYFSAVGGYEQGPMFLIFGVIAAASMVLGNLLALLQNNVKRILAYSSIAHLGYLFVAFLAGGDRAAVAVTFYLVAYFITTLAAFGVICVCSGPEREADGLEDYRGLYWRRPWLATVFTAALLSLAGIPLTVGFLGKFFVLAAGVSAALWTLVLFLVVNSAIGLFYYLRIIVVMIAQPVGETVAAIPRPSLAAGLTLAVLTALLFWLGVYPSPLLRLIESSVSAIL